MSSIQLSNVTKQIGTNSILANIDLRIQDGEFVVLLGPSGCGKTTLLRMIAGLEQVTSGEILIDGRPVNGLPPRVRNVAMVFQNYSLYLHKTVLENLEFGLMMRKFPKHQIKRRVEEVADLLHIRHLLQRKPRQLSGGEKQRVAIGRALVRKPDVYLFDEPLSNLDAALRLELRTEIKRIHQRFHTTSIFVTHDQAEAMSMADRLVVMDQGRIMQIGEVEEIYNNPCNLFVARFIGNPGMNVLPGTLESENSQLVLKCGTFRFSFASLGIPIPDRASGSKTRLTIGIRPEDISLKRPDGAAISMEAQVEVVERLGAETQVVMANEAAEFRIRVPERTGLKPGERATAYFRSKDVRLFDEFGDRILNPLSN